MPLGALPLACSYVTLVLPFVLLSTAADCWVQITTTARQRNSAAAIPAVMDQLRVLRSGRRCHSVLVCRPCAEARFNACRDDFDYCTRCLCANLWARATCVEVTIDLRSDYKTDEFRTGYFLHSFKPYVAFPLCIGYWAT